jgi:hypothetical protein
MEVEGIGTGKDFKLYPGGGREWNWRKTNTGHVPGIQPADVQDCSRGGMSGPKTQPQRALMRCH